MRNLPKLTERLYFKPWCVTPSHFQTLHKLLQSAKDRSIKTQGMMEDMDPEDESDELIVEDGVAYIPIHGTIGNNLSAFEKMCFECCDVRDLKSSLDEALQDERVETIVLDINSPGGESTYVDEVARYIAEVNKTKEVVAYCSDMMCSGAMYLAAGAGQIYAHPASTAIGSIGVYSAYLDESKAFADAGYKWDLFTAGKHKAQGLTGTSLSDDYKKLMQDGVDEVYQKFTSWMKETRGVSEDTMQGLVYGVDEALKLKLIDGITDDIRSIFDK